MAARDDWNQDVNEVPDHPELLLRERRWLVALARQLVHRHEVAAEAAHDALAAACTAPAPMTASPRTWLASILKKQLAGSRREAFRRVRREAQAARSGTMPPADDTVARFEVQHEVARAVLALAEPYRTTVLLRFWEELSPGAIGRRMQVPVETVRTRLKRGLAQLRERLDGAHGGDRRAWAAPLGALGRMDSVFASLLTGVPLMTSMHKLAAGAAVLAAALFVFVAAPWSSADPEVRAPAAGGVGSVAATMPAQRTAGSDAALPQDGASGRVEAALLATAGLVVTGIVVADETGTALAGVPVRLVGPSRTDLGIASVTAPDGSFTLREPILPEKPPRRVVVQGDDHVTEVCDVWFDAKRREPQRFDLGTIKLARGTNFAGQVVDQEGQPVANAGVFLPQRGSGFGDGWVVAIAFDPPALAARTDRDGRFRLAEPLAPDLNRPNVLFAVCEQGMGWCAFEASKQRREVGDLLIRLRPTGDVRVVVQEADGRPRADVAVIALPRFGPIGIDDRSWRHEVSKEPLIRSRFAGRTDVRGELALPRLPIGEPSLYQQPGCHERVYDLAVVAEGYPEQPLHGIELQAGSESRITIRLVKARTVQVAVDVRDDRGAAVAGAIVTAAESETDVACTDRSGHAELKVPATSKVRVYAEAKGHRTAHQQVDAGAGDPIRLTLTLVRTRPLDGRLVDQFGAPIVGMSVALGGQPLATTDREGRFHVDDFPLGQRKLIIVLGDADSSRWTREQTPETVDAEQGPVTITMRRRTGSVDVCAAVVDAATGQPLEVAQVQLCLYDERHERVVSRKRTTLQHGLVLAKDCCAGRWSLCLRTAGGHRGWSMFTLTEGQPPLDLRLALQAPGTVTGRLQFAGSMPQTVTVEARLVGNDPEANLISAIIRRPGRWQETGSQTVTGTELGQTGMLHMQPAQDATFRLVSADPTETLVITVRGEGVTGEARVRIEPGQTRECVIDVLPKPQRR